MIMMRTLGVVAAGLLLSACQGGAVGTTGTLEQDARVSPDDAQRAFGIVAGVDYLPFAYKADGCYARALYMSMELAAAGIPSSAQYIEGDLQPSTTIAWRYHVAPMLQVNGEDHETILDPSLSTGPVSLDAWITLDNPVGTYSMFYVPGSRYVAGINLNDPSQYNGPMIASFAELPAFQMSDIQSACNVMWSYLDQESPPRDDLQPKLVARTRELVPQLQALGKLTGYTSGATINCGP
jgi:hypothetical protein